MIGLEEIYWYLKLGKPKRKLSVYQLREDLPTWIRQPVFFLSTGRCGTQWISELLKKDRELAVFHHPVPNLAIQGKLAWESYWGTPLTELNQQEVFLQELFLAGRESHLRYTAKAEKRYVETNNYITFFAPVLARIFPDALFVHMVRHPAGFIRSALDRSYYTPGSPDDIKRIHPIQGEFEQQWDGLSQFARAAWLWKETNTFIDRFRASLPEHRSVLFPFDLSGTEQVQKVIDFLAVNISETQIKKKLTQKVNAQKNRKFPPYREWDEVHKEEVKAVCSGQASRYQFEF